MTASGTYNFSLSNGEAVLAAFERCQLRLPELRQEHLASARRELNLLFAELANRQVNLFKVELNTINLVQGTATYDVPARTVMILDSYRSINTGSSNQTNIYMTPISRTEYASYATPQTQGPPTVYWFDRLISPTVTFYPTPDGNGPYVWNYYSCAQMQDANLPGGETPDVVYRALSMLVAGLAYYLSLSWPPAGVDQLAFQASRKAEFDRSFMFFAGQDVENVNFAILPQLSGYYRI